VVLAVVVETLMEVELLVLEPRIKVLLVAHQAVVQPLTIPLAAVVVRVVLVGHQPITLLVAQVERVSLLPLQVLRSLVVAVVVVRLTRVVLLVLVVLVVEARVQVQVLVLLQQLTLVVVAVVVLFR
jgi:hypothetical protein